MKPQRVVVVGAGLVGLSTAFFLQERGVEVTVVDRTGVAAGASWGNAGWLSPALTVPLPEPAMLAFGMTAMFNPSSSLQVPLAMNLRLIRFLAGFTLASTPRNWRAAMKAFTRVNAMSMGVFDELEGIVAEPTRLAEPLVNGFTSIKQRDALVAALDAVVKAGGEADYELVSGDELRAIEPVLSENVTAGLTVTGQRFLNPPRFAEALAAAVRQRGGTIVTGFDVETVRDDGASVSVLPKTGDPITTDAVVIANGAWLGELAKPFGVRQLVQAGRGYSFSVVPEVMPTHPIDLPGQHVACTPLGDRFRVSGMMELRSANLPLDPRRIRTIVAAASPMFTGIDWESRREEWVGARPCTPDGLPLIGATRSPRVFVAGGHGMWGITLGPLTGKLLAAAIVGDAVDPVMHDFDPLR
jgi:D-amino-acid dehydrogenase